MSRTIYPGQSIGILGGGQLGKMLGQSAQKMGYRIAMYDEGEKACGFGVSHFTKIGSFNDKQSVLDFARSVDVLTYEFENINGEIVQELNGSVYFPQGADFLLTIQNRLAEKSWLNQQEISSVDYVAVSNMADLKAALEVVGYPAVLKTTRFGYDGKGQCFISQPCELTDNSDLADLLQSECILEAYCSFDYEASIIVSRDVFGTVECFPPVVNTHLEGILATSFTPPHFPALIAAEMKAIAEKIAQVSDLIGVCGIEFFVTAEGKILVNELAPRPHNTGHYTIEGCNVSQFDQHILAITGRPLIPVQLLAPTLMINILGQHIEKLPALMEHFPQAVIHLYDKGEPKRQRKMGHFTLIGDSSMQLEQLLQDDTFIKEWLEAVKGEEKNENHL